MLKREVHSQKRQGVVWNLISFCFTSPPPPPTPLGPPSLSKLFAVIDLKKKKIQLRKRQRARKKKQTNPSCIVKLTTVILYISKLNGRQNKETFRPTCSSSMCHQRWPSLFHHSQIHLPVWQKAILKNFLLQSFPLYSLWRDMPKPNLLLKTSIHFFSVSHS